jgi:hypothetical protein
MDDDREFATGCVWAIALAAFLWGLIVFAFLACRS